MVNLKSFEAVISERNFLINDTLSVKYLYVQIRDNPIQEIIALQNYLLDDTVDWIEKTQKIEEVSYFKNTCLPIDNTIQSFDLPSNVNIVMTNEALFPACRYY